MKMERNEKNCRIGRRLFVAQQTLEYFISILVTGSFLATMTKELGMSDSLTGILSSVVSLGCLFQLLSISIRPRRSKPIVVGLSIANQILFSLLYVIPLAGFGSQMKIALFVVAVVGAYFLHNLAHPKKISWLMSFVEDKHRGIFTANKEIISLLTGIAFSFGMGAVSDYFIDAGNIKAAFTVSAVVMVLLTISHTLSIVFAADVPMSQDERKSLKYSFKEVLGNKNVLSVAGLFALYYISTYCCTPFLGTYYISELGFNLKTVTALSIVGSISRVLVSRYWGKYADRNSFSKMIEKCFLFLLLDRMCLLFAVPANGIVMIGLYTICQGIAQGGINSAMINLVFDYAKPEQRSDSLAICLSVAGTVGFVATLLVSPLVSWIQANGNRVLGLPMYAQQFLSIISVVLVLALIVYNRTVVMKNKRV